MNKPRCLGKMPVRCHSAAEGEARDAEPGLHTPQARKKAPGNSPQESLSEELCDHGIELVKRDRAISVQRRK